MHIKYNQNRDQLYTESYYQTHKSCEDIVSTSKRAHKTFDVRPTTELSK